VSAATALGAAVLAAVMAVGGAPAGAETAPAPEPAPQPALAGGEAVGTGAFLTYSDKETVIEGGTVVPPDAAAPSAEAGVDLTGRGRAVAALGYSPYVEGAGLVNAFGGTDLPLGRLSDPARATVSGHPTQQAEAPVPGDRPAGRARAAIVDGPRAEAEAQAAGRDAAPPGVTVRIGQATATVDRGSGAGEASVTVVLRGVRVGDDLAFDAVRLTARAVADGAAGLASASSTVEGATFGGRPVRLTPRGLEPLVPGPAIPEAGSGVEVVAPGSEWATPGGREAGASATGPRLRLSTPDGRVLDVVLGRASASSTHVPAGDQGPGPGAAVAGTEPRRAALVARP